MKHLIFSLFSVITISLINLNNHKISANEELSAFAQICYGNSTANNRSTYHNFTHNVHTLISVLVSKSSSSSQYNTSVGEVAPRAYGSYLCRGDLKHRQCQACMSDVTKFLSRNDVINSDCYGYGASDTGLRCMVHYANSSTFSMYEEGRPLISGFIGDNVSDYQNYNETLSSTMQGLIREAALGNWTKPNFETRVVDVNGSSEEKVYLLVQCTPELSAMNCSKCLGELYSVLPDCCNGKQGGYVAFGYCLMKYNNQSFFGSAYHSFLPNFWHVTLVLLLTLSLVFMETL